MKKKKEIHTSIGRISPGKKKVDEEYTVRKFRKIGTAGKGGQHVNASKS